MKLFTIVGARPQFIKAAPVSRALKHAGLDEVLLHTGQHYDHNLSEIFFDQLQLPAPDYRLDAGSGTHGRQTGEMLIGIEEALEEARPDAVLVYGDTNSTLAGALAAAKLHIPVAHVEAGLRSFNRRMPEEVNRVMTDHLAHWLFCPTRGALSHLSKEGICEGVHHVGDVMLDAAHLFGPLAVEQSRAVDEQRLVGREFALVTIHRAENTDDLDRLAEIANGLSQLSKEIEVLLPLHPRTRKALSEADLLGALGAVRVVEPLSFLDMIALLRAARVVLTDSGGVQKEAYFHGTPCVTVREETEWTETLEAGWNRLVAAEASAMVVAALAAKPSSQSIEEYGGGEASNRIAETIAET